jgi:hypothetical protein
LAKDLDIALGFVPGDRQAAEDSLKTALGQFAKGQTVLVWAPDSTIAPRLATFLNRILGVRAIVTADPARAAANVSRHRPLKGDASLVLIRETFLKAQSEAVNDAVSGLAFVRGKVVDSLSKAPSDSNTMVIVAENNPRDKQVLLQQIDAAGGTGNLRDKFLVLQYCGEGKVDVAERILGWGASGVFTYEKKIFIPALELVLREVDGVLTTDPGLRADEAFGKAILRAMDKARIDPQYKRFEVQLKDMLNHLTISLLTDRKAARTPSQATRRTASVSIGNTKVS